MTAATTHVRVSKELKERLDGLKPYDSVSYNDIIAEACDHLEAARDGQAVASAGGETRG